MRLRTKVIILSVLAIIGIAVAIILLTDDEDQGVSVTLGAPRWTPPFLRYSLGGQERLMVLVRRTETENLPAGETRPPARGDRLEVRGFDATTLAPLFQAPVASIATNAAPSAGLLGEHAATIWIFGDTLGAVSGVDGQVLIERQGVVTLSPDIAGVLAQPRLNVWMAVDGLMLQTPTGPVRFHPRTLRAQAMPTPAEALPTPRVAAPFDARGAAPFRTNEARIGETWFGLPPVTTPPAARTLRPAIPGARFLPGGGQPGAIPQRLWRATLTPAPAAPTTPDAGFQGSNTRTPPSGATTALRLDAPTPVPFESGALGQAGFLTQTPHPDSEPIRPPGTPGLIMLHRTADTTLALTRINAQGSAAWTTPLTVTRVISLMPGEGPLLLAGTTLTGTETLIAVNLETGAIVTRALGE